MFPEMVPHRRLDAPTGLIAYHSQFAPRISSDPLTHVAVVGVVENGLVRLLDPRVRLPEQSRVIVVAAEPS